MDIGLSKSAEEKLQPVAQEFLHMLQKKLGQAEAYLIACYMAQQSFMLMARNGGDKVLQDLEGFSNDTARKVKRITNRIVK